MSSNSNFALCLICLLLTVTGCSITSPILEKEPIENTAFLKIGTYFEVNNTNENLILYDYKDTLASDGLYYASWKLGNAKLYENSDGDTVDLYDAQLYLLLGEFIDAKKAQENQNAWLEKGKSNYEILSEEQIICNGFPYLMITYTFPDKNSPYARGISAFGVYENTAICAELTCQENFTEDLNTILTEFLENCTYNK